MRYCIVFSESDPASRLIMREVLRRDGSIRHIVVPNAIDLEPPPDIDALIIASRHESENRIPCFCVHTPGNFGKAPHGGAGRELSVSFPELVRDAYLMLKARAGDMPVFLEATHHGPTIRLPCMYIEVGSTATEWNDEPYATTVAETILQLIRTPRSKARRAIGIGGQHYAMKLARVMEREDVAIGHICPKYNLSNLDEPMLKQMLERCHGGTDEVYVEWKGLGQEKRRIVDLLTGQGIEFKRI